MNPKKNPSKYMQSLRKRAEAELKTRMDELPDMSGDQIQNLIHELHTHQIELEMQNVELRQAQEQLAIEHEKYIALYDFAPVGYFTLNDEGVILEANLTLAELLGVNRRSLIKKPITNFISEEDQDIYYRHRQKLLDTRMSQTCEIRVKKKNRSICWMLITCSIVESNEATGKIQFRSTMNDISKQKRDEEVLQTTVHELNQFNRFLVSRETRTMELKKEINKMHHRLGEEDELPE